MTKDVVYLKHKTRTGGLLAVSELSFVTNSARMFKEGWIKSSNHDKLKYGKLSLDDVKAGLDSKEFTIHQVKSAGYEVEEVKPKPKKKKETPKGDEK